MGSFPLSIFFWYMYPIIVLIGSRFIVKSLSLTKRFKVKSPDIAVPFLWGGMHVLSVYTSEFSVLPFFFISVFLIGICVALFQAYYREEIVFPRYFKMTWRLIFLWTMILYVIFIVVSILHFIK